MVLSLAYFNPYNVIPNSSHTHTAGKITLSHCVLRPASSFVLAYKGLEGQILLFLFGLLLFTYNSILCRENTVLILYYFLRSYAYIKYLPFLSTCVTFSTVYQIGCIFEYVLNKMNFSRGTDKCNTWSLLKSKR